MVDELTARFPNLTLVDVGAAVRQAQSVIDQVITAVQVVFLFALGAGPLAGVLLLSLNAWLCARKLLSASPALTLRDSV